MPIKRLMPFRGSFDHDLKGVVSLVGWHSTHVTHHTSHVTQVHNKPRAGGRPITVHDLRNTRQISRALQHAQLIPLPRWSCDIVT